MLRLCSGSTDCAKEPCWIHAERLAHKLDVFTDRHRLARQCIRKLIWYFYTMRISGRSGSLIPFDRNHPIRSISGHDRPESAFVPTSRTLWTQLTYSMVGTLRNNP